MAEVLARAISMMGIIILGYVLKERGFLNRSLFPVLSRITINITLPCVIISKFSDFDMNRVFLVLLPIGIAINLFTILIGYLSGAPGGRAQRAFNMINLSGFNIGAFVLPFTQVFLGAEGVVALCVFDCGNSIMCTGGTYAMASMVAGEGERQGIKGFLVKLFSSIPMDVYVLMVILSFFHIKLPLLVRTFAGIVGNANAFLAMLIIGIGFEWRMKREEVKETVFVVLTRYAIAVVCAVLAARLLPFSSEVIKAMILAAFAPLSALTPVFTERTGGDVSLSSTINSITILISTIIITTLLVVL